MTLDLVNQRLAPTPMEPRSVLASYDAASERLTLRLSSQMPSGARDMLCDVLGIPPTGAGPGRRRRRRLWDEDRHLSGRRRARLGRAQIRCR